MACSKSLIRRLAIPAKAIAWIINDYQRYFNAMVRARL